MRTPLYVDLMRTHFLGPASGVHNREVPLYSCIVVTVVLSSNATHLLGSRFTSNFVYGIAYGKKVNTGLTYDESSVSQNALLVLSVFRAILRARSPWCRSRSSGSRYNKGPPFVAISLYKVQGIRPSFMLTSNVLSIHLLRLLHNDTA